MIRWYIVLFFVAMLFVNYVAFAVPPPDFIFQVASQIWTFFALSVAFLWAFFVWYIQIIKQFYQKHRTLILIWWTVLVLWLSAIIAYVADQYYQESQQQKMNQEWMNENGTWELWFLDLSSRARPGIFVSETYATDKLATNELTTKQVKELIKNKTKEIFLLDARESLEREYGYIPNSTHYREADLMAWDWKKLPKNRLIIVFCWSGIRWKEVSDFLNKQWLTTKFVQWWANGRVESKWNWSGAIQFAKIYPADRYKIVYTKENVKKQVKKWTILIDVRTKKAYDKKHIQWAVNFPLKDMTTTQVKEQLASMWKWKTYISLCDDYVNCFYAKIIGVYIERTWNKFLWRYNRAVDL